MNNKAGYTYLFATAMAVWQMFTLYFSPMMALPTVIAIFFTLICGWLGWLTMVFLLGYMDECYNIFRNEVQNKPLWIMCGAVIGFLAWLILFAIFF